jgi:hypothetical protein
MMQKIKDLLGLAREILLFILFLMLVFFPKPFNTLLSNAGITEIGPGGFTWKETALQSKVAGDSLQKIAEASNTKLEETQAVLEKVSNTASTPEITHVIDSSKKALKTASINLNTRVQNQKMNLQKIFQGKE